MDWIHRIGLAKMVEPDEIDGFMHLHLCKSWSLGNKGRLQSLKNHPLKVGSAHPPPTPSHPTVFGFGFPSTL